MTADRALGRLPGAQLIGANGKEIAKRIDVVATAIFNAMTLEQVNDLDLSSTPPRGSPWDVLQVAAQASRSRGDEVAKSPSRSEPTAA